MFLHAELSYTLFLRPIDYPASYNEKVCYPGDYGLVGEEAELDVLENAPLSRDPEAGQRSIVRIPL